MLKFQILILLSSLLLFSIAFSQTENCKCEENFCQAIKTHEIVIGGLVKKVKSKNGITKYTVKVKEVYKGDVDDKIDVNAYEDDKCIETLKKKKDYVLFLVQNDGEYWLTSCYNQKLKSLSEDDLKSLESCPNECGPVCSIFCFYGNVIDESGCPTCNCNPPPTCPWGASPHQCTDSPCASTDITCPGASECTVDPCVSCDPIFFDPYGYKICQQCKQIECDLSCEMFKQDPVTGCATCECQDPNCPLRFCHQQCENGYALDRYGCPTCSCNQCPGGEKPVTCDVKPCSYKPHDCPQAATCVDSYCGSCKAHYYDKEGVEICQKCPEAICSIQCDYGYVFDENNCQTCECKEAPKCPDGTEPVSCLTDPCENKDTECPNAPVCVSDYCGGCNAYYYDLEGLPFNCGAPVCDEVTCALACKWGFNVDEKGCPICSCAPEPVCEDGTQPVECLIDPCLEKETSCPGSRCVPEYCGGCNPKYYNKDGEEICNDCDSLEECSLICEFGYSRDPLTGCLICQCNSKCDNLICNLYCEYGFQIDENGCEICDCKQPDSCPDGSIPVGCIPDPCDADPPCAEAQKCVVDHCRECTPLWLDIEGEVACD